MTLTMYRLSPRRFRRPTQPVRRSRSQWNRRWQDSGSKDQWWGEAETRRRR